MTSGLVELQTGAPLDLFGYLPEIRARIGAARHVFLFLDFDGTLAPIVDTPESASLSAEIRELLIRLNAGAGFSIALISGRELADLRERVGVEGLVYAGDHGFSIAGPGLRFVEPVAAGRTQMLEEIVRDLELRLRHIPGARVERKGLTASVHYRLVEKAERDELRRIVSKKVAASDGLFHTTQGLMVLEVRPRVPWNKGEAAKWILQASGRADALPICLGDDATDEDAFAALAGGITIRIGRPVKTAARYQLKCQGMVQRFLAWLADTEAGVTKT